MLIDWFTVIAQIVNFLVLVLLLRRFLYRPIMNAMTTRESKIADRLAQAEEQREAARAEIEAYQQKNAAFEQERETLMREAQKQVGERRKAWLEQAKQDVEQSRSRWQKALAEEKESFLQTARQQAGQQTYQVIRRALADLADEELEARIVKIFLARVAALPEAEAKSMIAVLKQETAVLTINSSFDIDNTDRQALRKAIFARFGPGQAIEFHTTPDLICGLELAAPGHKIAWSLASYMDELEEALLESLAAIPPHTPKEEETNG